MEAAKQGEPGQVDVLMVSAVGCYCAQASPSAQLPANAIWPVTQFSTAKQS